jgi:hypothetical protein
LVDFCAHHWVNSLCRSFTDQYQNEPTVKVFGGKPGASPDAISTSIKGWMREFLYDAIVVEVDETPAPFKKGRNIKFIKRAIWQIESEMANNGSEVAKDLSKLRVGSADNKLLLVRETTQADGPRRWLDFIGQLVAGMEGNIFLGLMPTYSSKWPDEAQQWRDCVVAINVYHRPDIGSRLGPIGLITAVGT